MVARQWASPPFNRAPGRPLTRHAGQRAGLGVGEPRARAGPAGSATVVVVVSRHCPPGQMDDGRATSSTCPRFASRRAAGQERSPEARRNGASGVRTEQCGTAPYFARSIGNFTVRPSIICSCTLARVCSMIFNSLLSSQIPRFWFHSLCQAVKFRNVFLRFGGEL